MEYTATQARAGELVAKKIQDTKMLRTQFPRIQGPHYCSQLLADSQHPDHLKGVSIKRTTFSKQKYNQFESVH